MIRGSVLIAMSRLDVGVDRRVSRPTGRWNLGWSSGARRGHVIGGLKSATKLQFRTFSIDP
jgi:hypothetical protein